jgi:hypothetical protein
VHGIMGSFGTDVRLTQFGFLQNRFADMPAWRYWFSGDQLLMLGGGLLLVAAVLMGIQRRRAEESLEDSPFRHELISYLSRIANALERMEGHAPHSGQAAADMLRQLVNASTNDKVRVMPKYRSK